MLCLSQIHTDVKQMSSLPGTPNAPFPPAHRFSKSSPSTTSREETQPQFSPIHPAPRSEGADRCITSMLPHLAAAEANCCFSYCPTHVTRAKPGHLLVCSLSTRPSVSEVQQFTIVDVCYNNTIAPPAVVYGLFPPQPFLCNHKGRKSF